MIAPEQVAAMIEELRPYFTTIVEAQLKDYGESANAGCWVSLRLPSPEDLEPFRGQDRSGRNARQGKRYTLMLIALDDQDAHEQNKDRPRKLSQVAGAVGESQAFQYWVSEVHGHHCSTPQHAADFIRSVCGVESRSELDTNPEAAKIFREILSEYDSYRT